jgi:hypothetical protein
MSDFFNGSEPKYVIDPEDSKPTHWDDERFLNVEEVKPEEWDRRRWLMGTFDLKCC